MRTYVVKSNETLNKRNPTVRTVRKFINLIDNFLGPFKGRGCYITMEGACMGELLAMVACKVWKLKVRGTTQTNQCSTDNALVKVEMKMTEKGSYE